MINERIQLIIRLISTHLIAIPLLILISIFINSDLYLLLAVSQSLLVILFFAGYWEFLGMKFRKIYSVGMEFLLLVVFIWKIASPVSSSPNLCLIIIIGLILMYLLSEIIKMLIVIFQRNKNNIEICFPFKKGSYLVTDGGNSRISRLMNYHFYSFIHRKNRTNYSMLFATDIIKIEDNVKIFFPLKNEDYPLFGEKVYSPFAGSIVKVENEINDNNPYCGNYPYNTGNTIVIRRNNYYMLIGHLKKGSIKVSMGQEVSENELLGEAGNSGYSERPHIHMQLIESDTENYWKGMGVSMSFRSINLYKNRIIEINERKL